MNFWTANRYCQIQYGSTLASIPDLAADTEVTNACTANDPFTPSICWIGLTNIYDVSSWQYIDNSNSQYIPSSNNLASQDTQTSRCASVGLSWTNRQCESDEFTFFCNFNGTRVPTAATPSPSLRPSAQPTAAPSRIPTPSPTQPPQYELVMLLFAYIFSPMIIEIS